MGAGVAVLVVAGLLSAHGPDGRRGQAPLRPRAGVMMLRAVCVASRGEGAAGREGPVARSAPQAPSPRGGAALKR